MSNSHRIWGAGEERPSLQAAASAFRARLVPRHRAPAGLVGLGKRQQAPASPGTSRALAAGPSSPGLYSSLSYFQRQARSHLHASTAQPAPGIVDSVRKHYRHRYLFLNFLLGKTKTFTFKSDREPLTTSVCSPAQPSPRQTSAVVQGTKHSWAEVTSQNRGDGCCPPNIPESFAQPHGEWDPSSEHHSWVSNC